MKKFCLITGALFLLISCAEYRKSRSVMDAAEALMMTAPDSSLALLRSIDEDVLRSRGARARYALLSTMAKDKCYIEVAKDTVIQESYSWYQRHGSKRERMLATYYLGVVNEQAGDNIEAVLAFREAEPLAESLEDYRQLSLIDQHLSDIFYQNYESVQSIEYAKNALKYAEMAEDSLMASFCRYDLATRLLLQFRYKEAAEFLSQILQSDCGPSLYSYAAQVMAEVYFFQANPDIGMSKALYQKIEELKVKPFNSHDYGILAGISEYEHNPQQADSYLETAKGLILNSVDSLVFFNDSRNVYDMRGDWKRAYDAMTESGKIQNRTVLLLLEHSLNHAMGVFYEKSWFIEKYKARIHHLATIMLGIALSILGLIIFFVVNKRNRMLLDDMAKTQDLSNDLVHTLIADKITELQRLSEAYFSWEDGPLGKREKRDGRQTREEIISSFRAQLNELRSDHSFVETLEKSLNLSDDNLMKEVRQSLVGAKELDFTILALLFSGFSIKSISYLLRMSEASLRMRKTRYKQQFDALPLPNRMRFIEKLG